MPRLASRLIAIVLLISSTVTSVGPRGAVLCLGGGHDWNEIIAARGANGRHHHGGASDHAHASSDCTQCEFSHHHDEEHGPCTDIPLDADDARPGVRSSDKSAGDLLGMQVVGTLLAWSSHDARKAMFTPPRLPNRDGPGAPRQITASLRAVVLRI